MNHTYSASYTSGEKALTDGQVATLLNTIPKLEDLVLIKLAICIGTRRKDIINIKTKDIDLDKAEVTYYEHKKHRTRTVPIPPTMVTELRRWLNINKGVYLFPSRRAGSEHMSSKTAYNILQAELERAGLPSRPFHALRATCVKLCQRRGWSPEQTAKLIGDKVATVQNHYSTPSDEELKEVTGGKALV